jgi:NADH-quinone oxidoreductase subunit C
MAEAVIAGSIAAEVLQRELPGVVLQILVDYGEETIYLDRENLVAAAKVLRDHKEAQYTIPLFVAAVDWPERENRFEVVYQFRSMHLSDVCRLVVRVPEDDPHVPTLEKLFPGMDWLERECFDLSGIIFEGHHDLRRILLPEDWEGHPLRKDYISFGEPIAFTHNLEWALPARERPTNLPGETR